MGNNVCTDSIPFTNADLFYMPDGATPSSSLLNSDSLISADVVQSFQGFDHNVKALRVFYRDSQRQGGAGKPRRQAGGGGGDLPRAAHAASTSATTTAGHRAGGTDGAVINLAQSRLGADELYGVEPVHLSASHVSVHSEDVYILIHVQRSSLSAPPTSTGPSPREVADTLGRTSGLAGSRADADSGATDSLRSPAWARAMAEVFTPRGLKTPFARSVPRPSLQSSPRWSARRMYASEHTAPTASGSLEPPASVIPPYLQTPQQVRHHTAAGAYEYYFSLHMLTGKDAPPLVGAHSVLHAMRLERQLKEHPDQIKYLFYNLNRSRLVSGERGGSRTSRRDRAILTVTSPCLVGRLSWPPFVGNPTSLPAQRLTDSCLWNGVLRCLQSGGVINGTTVSPRAVSSSATPASSSTASPRTMGRAVGTPRGSTGPNAAYANRAAAAVAAANNQAHGSGSGTQQGPPTLSLPPNGHDDQAGEVPAGRRRPAPRPDARTFPVGASTTVDKSSGSGNGNGGRYRDPGHSSEWTTTVPPSSSGNSLADGEGRPTETPVTASPSCFCQDDSMSDTGDILEDALDEAPAGGHSQSPVMMCATATPSTSSASSPHAVLPNLNLSRTLPGRANFPSTMPHAPSADAQMPLLNLGGLRLSGIARGPSTAGAGRRLDAYERDKEAKDDRHNEDDDGIDDDVNEANTPELDDDADDAYEDFDETDERRMSEDRVNRLRQVAPYATQILPWLFVGGETAAKDRDQLLQKGITAVVNTVAFNVPNHFQDCFAYLSLNLQDLPGEPIFSLFPYVNAFVEQARLSGGKTFIHCHQGVSRSCSFAIAYIMWSNGLCYDSAYELVRAKRLVCSPNSGFYVNLRCWEEQLAHPTFDNGFAYVPHSESFLFPFSFRKVFSFCAAAARAKEESRRFHVVHPLLRIVTSQAGAPSALSAGAADDSTHPAVGSAAPILAGDGTEYVLDNRLCYGFVLNVGGATSSTSSTTDQLQLRSFFVTGSQCPSVVVETAFAQWKTFLHFNYFRGYVAVPDDSEINTARDSHSSASTSRPPTPAPIVVDNATSVDRNGKSVVYTPVPEVCPFTALPNSSRDGASAVVHSASTVDELVRDAVGGATKRGARPTTPRSGMASLRAGWPRCVMGTDALCGALLDAHGGLAAVAQAFYDYLQSLAVDNQVRSRRPSPSSAVVRSPRTLLSRPSTAPPANSRPSNTAGMSRAGRVGGEGATTTFTTAASGATTPRAGGTAGALKRRRRSSPASSAVPEGGRPELAFVPPGEVQPQTPPTANRAFHRSTGERWASAASPLRLALPQPSDSLPTATATADMQRQSHTEARADEEAEENEQEGPRKLSSTGPLNEHAATLLGSAVSDEDGTESLTELGERLADVEVYPYPFHAETREEDVAVLEDLDPQQCYAIAVPTINKPVTVFIRFGELCTLDRDAVREQFLSVFATPATRMEEEPTLTLSAGRRYRGVPVRVVEAADDPDELLTAF